MEQFEIAIAGAGLAAAKTVEAYRAAGGDGTVVVLGGEAHPPYHRPPLSKRLLRGEAEPESAFVHPIDWYAEQDAELRFGTTVTGLDLEARSVHTTSGDVRFGRLVVATGALPRPHPGAMTLRTIDDSLAIRERAQAAGRVVVIGTGFIGCEVCASLCTLGLDVVLATGGRPLFGSLGSPEFSEYLARLYGEQHAVLADEPEEGDVVVAGIGVEPATAWLEASGLALDDGVVVDERFQASAPNVYAVGDVAHFRDPVFGHARRIEHWSNANYQGTQLGKLLAGEDAPYDTVSSFFTELFGKTFRFFGEVGDERELEGSFDEGRAIVRYRKGGRLVGALATGLTDEDQDGLKAAIRADAAGR